MGRHSKAVTRTGLRTGFGDTGVTCVVTALDSCKIDSISALQTHAPKDPYESPLCLTTRPRVLRWWVLLLLEPGFDEGLGKLTYACCGYCGFTCWACH